MVDRDSRLRDQARDWRTVVAWRLIDAGAKRRSSYSRPILIGWWDKDGVWQSRLAWWDPRHEERHVDKAGKELLKKPVYTGAWTDNAVKSFGYEEVHTYPATHCAPPPSDGPKLEK